MNVKLAVGDNKKEGMTVEDDPETQGPSDDNDDGPDTTAADEQDEESDDRGSDPEPVQRD